MYLISGPCLVFDFKLNCMPSVGAIIVFTIVLIDVYGYRKFETNIFLHIGDRTDMMLGTSDFSA